MGSQAAEIAPTGALELAKRLIARKSVTPDDNGCQDIVMSRLRESGFVAQELPCRGVRNIWLGHGADRPSLLFLGHTDVVPAGAGWSHGDPFEPQVVDGFLHGRGAADMKGAVAAMVVAMESFVKLRPRHSGQLALALTSDEEGPAEHGSRHIADWLREQGKAPDYCLVGEPTAVSVPGDAARCGRRGSISARVSVVGKQGHVAYPDKCVNPVHLALLALARLIAAEFDRGNEHFPATSLQIVHVNAGDGKTMNVVPGNCELAFNLRYSPETDAGRIRGRVEEILHEHAPGCGIAWEHGAEPFYSGSGPLHEAVRQAAREVADQDCVIDAAGGTSDGRFMASLGAQVVELGLCNETIHQVDERVEVSHLRQLAQMYLHVMLKLLP